MLKPIADLKLPWRNVLAHDTVGAWVAENWLGLARVAPWMYDDLELLQPDADPPYERPAGSLVTLGRRRVSGRAGSA